MMKKDIKKVYILFLVIILASSVFANIVQAVSTAASEPGSDGDPIVTKSYVDSNVEKSVKELQILQDKYNQLLEEMKVLKGQLAAGGYKGFSQVSIEVGQTIYTGEGTEIILKSGKANAIKGKDSGLTDTNSAKELASGIQIAANHLLISSSDDGSGLRSLAKSLLLIRGVYRIETDVKEEKPDEQEKITGSGIINATALNIREKPDTGAAILAKAAKGEGVSILSKNGDWYRVKTAKGIIGWALGTYITLKK